MSFRPFGRIAPIALLLQAVALPVQAVPVASIRWGACPASLGASRYDPTSKNETITVTATGLTGTVRSVRFAISIWAGGSQVPDAWRFDSAGCEGGLLAIGQTPSDPLCPPLRGTHASEFSRLEYLAFPPGGWTGGRELIQYGIVFDPLVADATKTYTIARLDIDHSNAILGGAKVEGSCNCLERPLCISLLDVIYEDGEGEHTMLQFTDAIHWNDSSNSLACPLGPDLCDPDCGWGQDTTCVVSAPTPAATSSWGRVKAGYR